ncbi:MAG: rane protein of unknown function [Candidatus Peribacteria bacterium]|nr:rane protein of unknown function [Candidatus Peribacteria bacterium]
MPQRTLSAFFKPPAQYAVTIFLWAAIGIACFQRVGFLQLMEYKYDEQQAWALAGAQWHGNGLALTGLPSSVGLLNPPLFTWILGIPALISSNPLPAAAMIAWLNVAGIALLYVLLRKNTNASVALWTTALFASAPWAIIYSRKIWAQDLLFPFFVCLLIVLMSLLENYKPWKLILLFMLTAFLTQLHMSAWCLPFTLGIFLILQKIPVKTRDMYIGCLVFLLIYSPYVWYQLQTHGQNILYALHKSTHESLDLVSYWQWSAGITSGNGFEYLLGKAAFSQFLQQPFMSVSPVVFTFYVIIAGISFLSVAYQSLATIEHLIQRKKIGTRDTLVFFLLLHFVLTTAAFFIVRVPVYPHYHIIFYPLFPLGVCLAAFDLSKKSSLAGYLFSLSLIIIMITNLLFTGYFFHYIHTQPPSADGDYGTPFRLQ